MYLRIYYAFKKQFNFLTTHHLQVSDNSYKKILNNVYKNIIKKTKNDQNCSKPGN